MEKTIYGDGRQRVSVGWGQIVLEELDEDGEAVEVVRMSEAAFREVVIGWERYLGTKPPAQTVKVKGIPSAEEHGQP